jgi:hypothetical protein
MNSSYAPDMFTQSSQFHPATYQPGPTRIYQNPNSVPSNVVHPAPPPPQHQAPPSQPHSIGELAERAKQILGEGPRPFKTWLRIAESARRNAKSFHEQGDLESAFVEYAKAATIVLEKIPAHPDYRVLLSQTQRHNMGLVSYFYLMAHDCGSVGRVHFPNALTNSSSVFFMIFFKSRSPCNTSYSHWSSQASHQSFLAG